MVRMKQVQDGFVRFIDNDVAGAFDGMKKIAVSVAAALLANNLPNLAASHPWVSMLGVYNSADDTVNIEVLHKAIADRLGNEKISIPITPKETIRLGREDLNTLVRYIKEA